MSGWVMELLLTTFKRAGVLIFAVMQDILLLRPINMVISVIYTKAQAALLLMPSLHLTGSLTSSRSSPNSGCTLLLIFLLTPALLIMTQHQKILCFLICVLTQEEALL